VVWDGWNGFGVDLMVLVSILWIGVIRQVVKAWTFEGGMREAAREANEHMEHSQYYHFPS
jgi:hypothetical protein